MSMRVAVPSDWRLATAGQVEELSDRYGPCLREEELNRTEVPLGSLEEAPKVFQPRDMEREPWVKRKHISSLARVVKGGDELDAITVFPVAGNLLIVDGHCSAAAYREAGKVDGFLVPAAILRGSFRDAWDRSMAGNVKDKLALTREEKWEAAWERLKYNKRKGLDAYSCRAIKRITGASIGTVTNMRKVMEREPFELGFDPLEESWEGAKRMQHRDKAKEYPEDWEDKLAREWGNRMRKAFGDKPEGNSGAFLAAVRYCYPGIYDKILEEARSETDEVEF